MFNTIKYNKELLDSNNNLFKKNKQEFVKKVCKTNNISFISFELKKGK